MGITRDIGKIHYDRQSGNLQDYYDIIDHFKLIYQTSGAAIRIRLKELNILIDSMDYKQNSKNNPEMASIILSRVFDSITSDYEKDNTD